MPGVVTTGWESKSFDEIRNEIKQAVWSNVSEGLNLSETSALGQIIDAVSSQVRQLWEAGAALYAARDPRQAEGEQLAELCRITGTNKEGATPSTVLMDITLAAGTYAAGSLIVYPTGRPNVRFANDAEITTAGATLTGQPFTCLTKGAIVVNANTLTQISSPVTGFSAPNNPAAAATGTDVEKDDALRLRREQSLSRSGSGNVDAIRADILEVDSVTGCTVLENETDTTDGNGVPPHSVYAIVRGGADADVAAVLWQSKGATAGTYGTTTVSHVDSQGNTHSVKFTRPSQKRVYVSATVKVLTGQYPASTFQTAEVAIHDCGTFWGDNVDKLTVEGSDGEWPTGQDVIAARLRAAVMMMPGVVDVVSLTLGTTASPVGTSNITVAINEYADIDYGDIVVTLQYVSAVP